MARHVLLYLLTGFFLHVLMTMSYTTNGLKLSKLRGKNKKEMKKRKLWPEDETFMRYVYGDSQMNTALLKSDRLRKLQSNLLKAKEYLTTFGYLPVSYKEKQISMHGLSSKQQNDAYMDFQTALMSFQRLSNRASKVRVSKITGKLDKQTLTKMNASRCALSDLNLNFPLENSAKGFKIHRNGYTKWRTKYLTYKIANYPSNGNLNQRDVDDVFAKAFKMWSRHIPLNFFQLKSTDSDNSVDIVIKFKSGYHGDGVPFDGKGGVLAHAFYPSTLVDDDSLAGDMHFDDDETFTLNSKQDVNTDLLAVASHELGHALGLEHSSLENAVMYPLFHKANQLGELSQDDIDGIQRLYCQDENGKILDACLNKPNVEPLIPPTLPTSGTALVTTPRPTPLDKDKPNPCNTTVDAVLHLRKIEIQFFKGPYIWRVVEQITGENDHYYQLFFPPSLRDNFWTALPIQTDRIDAVFERSYDNIVLFFRGRRFWAMANNHVLEENFPFDGKPLTSLGLPDDIDKIDAMFSWKGESTDNDRNRRIFIFSGDKYWRYVERRSDDCINVPDTFGCVLKSPLYPRPISDTWIGVPTPVDTAYTHEDGHTFFFKNNKIYRFNNIRMRVESRSFQNNELSWVGCTMPQGAEAIKMEAIISTAKNVNFDKKSRVGELEPRAPRLAQIIKKEVHSTNNNGATFHPCWSWTVINFSIFLSIYVNLQIFTTW